MSKTTLLLGLAFLILIGSQLARAGSGAQDAEPAGPAPAIEQAEAADFVGAVPEAGGEADAGVETPGWFSIVPPVVAIAAALIFRSVIPALFLGLFLGAWGVAGRGLGDLWTGLLDSFQVFVLAALVDPDHGSVILFSLMIGGMVGILLKNGGMQGVVEHVSKWTNTTRRAQLATSWLGIGIFFDDYANSLVVGNTMRSLTDKLKVSREKLAYLVDSTAAPVACLAFATTWIGFEVGQIDTGLAKVGAEGVSAYGIFLASIPYSFYPLLAIFFVLLVSYSGRDFGPMLKAERRARHEGLVLRPGSKVDEAATEQGIRPVEGRPRRAINAVLPVLVLLGTVLVGIWVTGHAAALESFRAGEMGELTSEDQIGLRHIIGNADSYAALMWAALLSMLTAALLSIGQRILTLEQTVDAWYEGVKSLLFAMIILVLAWALSGTTDELGTAVFLNELLGDSMAPGWVPAAVFLLAAATAFATGSSWGTMAILMPIVFPLAWDVLQNTGVTDPATHGVLFSSVSCVLAGAVWGDHCSPISDTTILSSMVSGCDHIDHVSTQLPYALLVGAVGLICGTVPVAFGLPWWLGLLLGAVVLLAYLRFFGRRSEDPIGV